jgi:hypothetical protein
MAKRTIKTVKVIGEEDQEGYPSLVLEVDGQRATVFVEQKAARAGLIFLGAEFEDQYEAVLPADPRNGRPEDQVMAGFTDDPRVLREFGDWWSKINGVDFWSTMGVSRPEEDDA